ncbi:hypothetical protein Taro_031675 [Colocasia esculenta]|uniref:Uncharacterized protein n=1 Tax=Colocasia esculenta TaxID=4460 RepID=A0A843VZN5_COLES|nr:hypothetical protein [Colocasia esculenta]
MTFTFTPLMECLYLHWAFIQHVTYNRTRNDVRYRVLYNDLRCLLLRTLRISNGAQEGPVFARTRPRSTKGTSPDGDTQGPRLYARTNSTGREQKPLVSPELANAKVEPANAKVEPMACSISRAASLGTNGARGGPAYVEQTEAS